MWARGHLLAKHFRSFILVSKPHRETGIRHALSPTTSSCTMQSSRLALPLPFSSTVLLGDTLDIRLFQVEIVAYLPTHIIIL